MDQDRIVVSDAVWAKIASLLPGKATDPGVTGKDNRLFLEAVLWRVRTGSPWRDLPSGFGHWNRAMYRWRHLIENTFAKLKEFRAIATRYDKTDGSFRATINLAAAIIASR